MPCTTCTEPGRCDRAGLCQTFARRSLERQDCPTCDGGGVVLDVRFTPPKRLMCGTCGATGHVDAGVWPYEPWPTTGAA